MDKYDKAIKVFETIRDLPYHIATRGEAGCDCEDKAKMLVSELEVLKIPARIRVGIFSWSSLDLPTEVTNVPHNDTCSHFFVEAENSKGEWVYVDPTWNKELDVANFTIADWDGSSSTLLAFNLDEILSLEESIEYAKHIDYELDILVNGAFYETINSYCDSFLL